MRLSNRKPVKEEQGKPAKVVYPTPKVYPPTPLLEHENPQAPPLKPKTTVKLPAKLPTESTYSFFQQMMIRSANLSEELKSGEILKLTFSYEQGLYIMKVEYS